ncbi:MAG: hypothetical protein J6K20_12690 [Thermoguttaceae bacterium]|nr:hypothetical protein [Thermoguttaceae bacterium]
MKREVWEELVDRVVDDECTDEERRALYEAAERNPEIREALDAALRIRELLRSSAGATVPPEFSERFRLAIERSDFWIDREIERPAVRPASTTASERVGGRRFLWATTGAAIAFAAVALLASNVGDGTRWGGVETARLDKTKKAAKSATDGEIGNAWGSSNVDEKTATDRSPRLPIRTPQSESTVTEATPVPYSDGFYTRRVLDSENARRIIAAFLRICRENGVEYEKFGGDAEFLLTKTSPDARNVIWRWLEENVPEIAPRAGNNFAETWNPNSEKEENVRISFCASENESGDKSE